MKLSAKQRDTVASLIGEGVHTGLRKWCDSPQSSTAHRAIRNLPKGEWGRAVEMAVVGLAEYFASAEFEQDGAE